MPVSPFRFCHYMYLHENIKTPICDLPLILWYKPHQIPKLKCFSSLLAAVFAQSTEARSWVENEDVVGATPSGDAPTTSEWSASLIPTKMRVLY